MTGKLKRRSARQNELDKLQKVIDQFINSCSHSMRGPLKTIEGLVNLLQTNNLGEGEVQELLNFIKVNTGKMENMLDEMEMFMENTNRDLNLHAVSFKSLAEGVLEEFKDTVAQGSIDVSLKVVQHNAFYTDQNRLRIALYNLIQNAFEYQKEDSPHKKVSIYISVSIASCTIAIADNGIGMDNETQANIFDIFSRGSEKSNGFGLGLYVAHEIIEKLKGNVTVNSEVNVGSKFMVWIPNYIQ